MTDNERVDLEDEIFLKGVDFQGGAGRWPTLEEICDSLKQFNRAEILSAFRFAEAKWRELDAVVDAHMATAPDIALVGVDAFLRWADSPPLMPKPRTH